MCVSVNASPNNVVAQFLVGVVFHKIDRKLRQWTQTERPEYLPTSALSAVNTPSRELEIKSVPLSSSGAQRSAPPTWLRAMVGRGSGRAGGPCGGEGTAPRERRPATTGGTTCASGSWLTEGFEDLSSLRGMGHAFARK